MDFHTFFMKSMKTAQFKHIVTLLNEPFTDMTSFSLHIAIFIFYVIFKFLNER